MQRVKNRVGGGSFLTLNLLAHVLLAGFVSPVAGHPLSQGALDVVVHPEGVAVRARVTLEEVLVTDLLAGGETPAAPEGSVAGGTVFERHARYLASHLHVTADGVPLAGRVVSAEAPATQPSEPGAPASGPDQQHSVYHLEYPLASPSRPQNLTLHHDVLVGSPSLAPGISWQTTYIVRVGVVNGPTTEGLLLTAQNPVEFACDWTATGSASAGNRWPLARDYAVHGVHHILTGYDHLLFIAALVLAATGMWDLVKVVTAFTLAHTITLALASLRLISLPPSIVEPMIAASIVLVALQNVLWPRQAQGWTRLAVAFGFGLFHGLGYAGGLLDAMQEMSGTTIVLAILAFSVGVEIGHQIVVLPLFALLKLARRTRSEITQRDRISLLALRYGSAAICVLGMYYLYAAVSSAVALTPAT